MAHGPVRLTAGEFSSWTPASRGSDRFLVFKFEIGGYSFN